MGVCRITPISERKQTEVSAIDRETGPFVLQHYVGFSVAHYFPTWDFPGPVILAWQLVVSPNRYLSRYLGL